MFIDNAVAYSTLGLNIHTKSSVATICSIPSSVAKHRRVFLISFNRISYAISQAAVPFGLSLVSGVYIGEVGPPPLLGVLSVRGNGYSKGSSSSLMPTVSKSW